MIAYRGWKIRLYRSLWQSIQKFWNAERWIRVTDDQGVAQFVQINKLGIDPNTGMPTIVNAVGQLDVDIIIDEGPDQINMMNDTYEFLSNVVPTIAPMLSGAVAAALMEVMIDTSPLPADAKKKFREAAAKPAPPSPEAQKAENELKLQAGKAQIEAQAKQQELELKAQESAAEIQLKQTVAAIEAAARQRESEQKIHLMTFEAEKKMEIERFKADSAAALKAAEAEQSLSLEHDSSRHEMQLSEQKTNASIDQQAKLASAKAKAMARARPPMKKAA
jgi:hypothetical protein